MPDTTQTPQLNQPQVGDAKSAVDILYADGQLTREQYDDIQVKSISTGQSPTEILKDSNIISNDKIARAIAKLVGIDYIDLASVSFSPAALGMLPQGVVERLSLIPFMYDEKNKVLSIAMGDPLDLDAVAFVRQKTGLNIKTFASDPEVVKNAIGQQYQRGLVGDVTEAIKETEEFNTKRTVDSKQIGQIITDAPIAKIVSTILEFAVTSRASDVHIEPQEERVRVRYRIDGILYDKLSLPRNVEEQLVSRIKILAELKIDERRIPQDGRLNFKVDKEEVDLRVSTIPTVKGEKIVLRLLRKSGGVPTLQELGLLGNSLKNLETATLRAHGIILVCGPTGSGKTTTLYSMLSRLNTTRVNIASLEDPVEYEIPGVNQVQINPAVGLTFASGLRAFLRQDPNIILVGEIRDKETTDLAIQAALTGHLVFSTLHTSNAAGALPRLVDLGAEPFLLASTINAIAAQRIVRRICQTCKVEFVPPSALVIEIKNVLGNLLSAKDEIKLYRGKGCDKCENLGYVGRIGIYEVMPASEKISHLIITQTDNTSIEKQAIADGMITLKQDGYLKVVRGETTIEEVLRVAQE
ncbi:MAG TPA: GspE/PulE family protein [Candidatus Saccharimonadales bacterium]|nr:GspE/PulE family protein [Candidatus Saccharimonadales bacterium]